MLDDGEGTRRLGRKWRKVLYGGVQPGYEDNYTDESFLEAMVMNANVVKRETWTVMRDSVAISQHVCVVGLVGIVWVHALNGVLNGAGLLLLDALILALGCVTLILTTQNVFSTIFWYRQATNFCLFVTGLYILAPVLQTLTRSLSSDSILASTVCLLILHLLFHDYTYSADSVTSSNVDVDGEAVPKINTQGQYADHLSSEKVLGRKSRNPLNGFLANVSLNASIVASVLIASRLPDQLSVFGLVLFSLEFFVLFPLVTHSIKERSANFHLVLSCALIVMTMTLIFHLSHVAFSIFSVVILFITVVGPYWLIKIQEYKFEINGPWDEAKLCFDLD